MIAEAYAYADGGGGMPKELILAHRIDRFGTQAVLGRMLNYSEIKRIEMAEYVVNAYMSRKASNNYAEWVGSNQRAAELLAYAEGLNNG
jgi:hypothetical protein